MSKNKVKKNEEKEEEELNPISKFIDFNATLGLIIAIILLLFGLLEWIFGW